MKKIISIIAILFAMNASAQTFDFGCAVLEGSLAESYGVTITLECGEMLSWNDTTDATGGSGYWGSFTSFYVGFTPTLGRFYRDSFLNDPVYISRSTLVTEVFSSDN